MNPKTPRLVVNTLLTAMGALGTVFCVTTAFSISVSVAEILLVAVLTSFFFSGCFLFRRFLYGLIPLGLGLLGAIFLTNAFSSLQPTLIQLTHDILTRFSSAYPNISFAIPGEPQGVFSLNYSLLFSTLAFFLSIWMAWGVGYRSCLITVAGSLPFLLLCVIINDTPPHVFPIILLMAVWVTSLLNRERPGEPPAMDATRIGLILFAVILLLGTVGIIYPKNDTRNHELPELVETLMEHLPEPMQQMLDRNSTGVKKDELGADTSRTLDLTQQGTRDRKDTVMMQLSTTELGPLYLRGAAKDIYTGSSWESSDMASVADAVYAQTSLGTAFGVNNQAAVHIKKTKEDSNVLFVPYGFISCPSAEDVMSDLRINTDEDDYIAYYWPGVRSLDLSTDGGESRESYDSYVYDTCLSLPEDTRTTLYDLAISYGYDPDMTIPETVAWVAQFIRSSGTYRLDVSRQPTNYDFAVYFLTESNQGYCVHFATAAAAMYRALGIPARYASGYRVTVPTEGAVVDVTDRDTHAWAEVYITGLGWIPVETTPGFGETSMLPQVQQPQQDTQSPAPATPSPSPSATATSPSPSPSQPSPSPSPTEGSTTESSAVPSAQRASQNGTSPLVWIFTPLGCILLGLLVLWIRRRVILSRRARGFQSGTSNEIVLHMWQYLEKLQKWGGEISPETEALALKAKFSPHTITPEEQAPYEATVYQTAVHVEQQLTRWQRLRFRWLSCLDITGGA